ncbi:helix-turn-helix domain-containing protein [Sphaerisporangium sp. NPDC051017]|uniref:helix-turn-helix domain-containing protein n=1 Tax=Sphaerisporangium sp. NPDC051017 TaxID=3154636 RepID=UPI003424F1B0
MADKRYRRPLAEQLDHLFRTVRQPDGTTYSYEQAAREIARRGTPVSHTTLWKLRTGRTDDLSVSHLVAIAGFFGVEPAYFFDDAYAEQANVRLELLPAMRDAGVRRIAMRAAGLSHSSIENIAVMIAHLRTLEGLPPDSPGAGAPSEKSSGEDT